jgi:hypothetical protein
MGRHLIHDKGIENYYIISALCRKYKKNHSQVLNHVKSVLLIITNNIHYLSFKVTVECEVTCCILTRLEDFNAVKTFFR